MIKSHTAEQLEVILDECIFTALDAEMHGTATSVATEQIMQLIDSAITEARIEEWQSLEVHPNDAEIYLADSELAWYKASEAIRIRIAQLKNNTTKEEEK